MCSQVAEKFMHKNRVISNQANLYLQTILSSQSCSQKRVTRNSAKAVCKAAHKNVLREIQQNISCPQIGLSLVGTYLVVCLHKDIHVLLSPALT
jgi:hypothetical protein